MNKTIILTLILTALFLSIHSYGQKDSAKYCFTGVEMNEWIKSAINEKKYKLAYDTMQKVDSLNLSIIGDLKRVNSSADSLIESQKKVIKNKRKTVILWQAVSGLLAGLFVWNEIKD